MPSEQKVSVGKLINVLPIFRKRNDITVVLTKKWLNDEYVNPEFISKFHVHYSTFFTSRYEEELMTKFKEDYKLRYDDYITDYSILGYDLMLYFGRALNKYGMDFPIYIGEVSSEGTVDTKFNFIQVGPDSGFENHGGRMVYFDDFQLKEIVE